MEEIQQRLIELRRRIARVDRKWNRLRVTPLPTRHMLHPAPMPVEEALAGEAVRTPLGCHFETERRWERHQRWGSVGIADLRDLPSDWFAAISDAAIPPAPPERWAFLDTETTGLGAGACAFLAGVGSIDSSGFRVRQFFLRDFGEEPSLLWRLAEYLGRFELLVTYNGRSFDQPLLEARYKLARLPNPLARLPHFDLLFGARRLWKPRVGSCRLMELENRILGVEREGDLPGELIPYFYSEFQRTERALQLVPIFHHNAIDILSLACLAAVVPRAFRSPETFEPRHGADLIGLARWMRERKRRQEGLALLRRAVDIGLPDSLLFGALWEIARAEKGAGAKDAALAIWRDLAVTHNPYAERAREQLAREERRLARRANRKRPVAG